MQKCLKGLPEETRRLVESAGRAAQELGFKAYLVGGFVRDLLLNKPNFDLDITVEGDGIVLAQSLSSKLNAKLVCHKRFGTATLVLNHIHKIDIATARKESYPYPGSLPVVQKGVLCDDLKRRDFSINAMALSLNKDDFGALVDLFGGRKDLNKGLIRVLHDLSFVDDPTRICRAVRFERRYDFKIEAHTLRLLNKTVSSGMMKEVQPQRMRDELILILKEDKPWKPVKRLQQLKALDFIAPGIILSRPRESLFKNIFKEISWFNKEYPKHRKIDSWVIYCMALFEGLDQKLLKHILDKFVFRKGEEKRILALNQDSHSAALALNDKMSRPSSVFRLLEPMSYEVIIYIKARFPDSLVKKNILSFLNSYNGAKLHIGGHDLLKLGMQPGPGYQKVLNKVLDAKINGLVKTREDELSLARGLIGKKL